MDVSTLESALRQAWTRETSSDPEHWTPDNPAWGQCAVTALVVNDHLGGNLVCAQARLPDGRAISHYLNSVGSSPIDLSQRQFPEGTDILIITHAEKTKGFASVRDYVLSYEATQKRYVLLQQRVKDVLDKKQP